MMTTQQQLQKLWDKARYRRYLPQNIVRFMLLRHKFNFQFIRFNEVKIAVPRGKIPDCQTCTEICCTGPNAEVSLRLRDIAALVDAGLSHMITHERVQSSIYAKSTATQPQAFHEAFFAHVFPVLKRDKTGTCALLTDNLLCGAYTHRPLSCVRYPYALDIETKTVFFARGCNSYNIVSGSEAHVKIRQMTHAAIENYNERIRDVILLHFARDELKKIGVWQYLNIT